jgi:4-amino-4-deoxy-L-arabinose transferase-like glycosyltransferase
MRKLRLVERPFLLFAPFLLIYAVYVILYPPDMQGDQSRYLGFAHNLLNGFYSPPGEDIDLTNGPGYPMLLVPFVALGLPGICITLMNALFYYLSTVFLYKALKQLVKTNLALIFSLLWACYYVAYQAMNVILTECFVFFLVSIIIFSLVEAFKTTESKAHEKYKYIAGFAIGVLILTKMLFGYVLILMICGSVFLYLTDRSNVNYRKGLFILFISFVSVTPYLAYTYHLTGRLMYWGTGSDSLYWMSTPYSDEYGDWKRDLNRGSIAMGNFNIPGAEDSLKKHHKEDFDEIYKHTGIERDDVFKEMAIRNIKAHPGKFAENIVYNAGRLIFHYPFSNAVQRPKTLLVLPINGIIFTLVLFSLFPTFANWRRIIFPIRFMLFFCFIYLGLSLLVSAYVRMFTVAVPFLLFWIAYIIHNSVTIKMKFQK